MLRGRAGKRRDDDRAVPGHRHPVHRRTGISAGRSVAGGEADEVQRVDQLLRARDAHRSRTHQSRRAGAGRRWSSVRRAAASDPRRWRQPRVERNDDARRSGDPGARPAERSPRADLDAAAGRRKGDAHGGRQGHGRHGGRQADRHASRCRRRCRTTRQRCDWTSASSSSTSRSWSTIQCLATRSSKSTTTTTRTPTSATSRSRCTIVQKLGGMPILDITLRNARMYNPYVVMPVPDNVERAYAAAAPDPQANVDIQKAGTGVFFVTGASHNSIAVEFKDYVAVIESPLGDNRAVPMFEAVRKQFPNKRIRYLINSHNHFDHAGGLRDAVAEGTTIVTAQANKPYYEKVLINQHTVNPDRLQKTAPTKKPSVEAVTDKRVLHRRHADAGALQDPGEQSRRHDADCLLPEGQDPGRGRHVESARAAERAGADGGRRGRAARISGTTSSDSNSTSRRSRRFTDGSFRSQTSAGPSVRRRQRRIDPVAWSAGAGRRSNPVRPGAPVESRDRRWSALGRLAWCHLCSQPLHPLRRAAEHLLGKPPERQHVLVDLGVVDVVRHSREVLAAADCDRVLICASVSHGRRSRAWPA